MKRIRREVATVPETLLEHVLAGEFEASGWVEPERVESSPRARVAPPGASATFGPVAARLAAEFGLVLDGWQKGVLDDWLAVRGDGRRAALTQGVSVARQNGKGAVLEALELFEMVARGSRILHSAHQARTSEDHYRRMQVYFGTCPRDPGAQFPELNALVTAVRSTNGRETITLSNGAKLQMIARSKNSGRGLTADVLVLDEAQELSEDALQAILPVTSAARRGDPAWIFTGTPPGPVADGEVFTRIRKEALSGESQRLTWSEWSPKDGHVDVDDEEVWRVTNPGLVSGRLAVETIRGERTKFSEGGFARERLGRWAPEGGKARRAISDELWRRTDAAPPQGGARTFGVAFSRDGSRVALAGAMKHEKGVHVNLVDAQTGSTTESGVAVLAQWLAQRFLAEDRSKRPAQVVVSGAAGADVLVDALVDLGVQVRRHAAPESRPVRVALTKDYLGACSMLLDGLRAGTVTHPNAGPDNVLEASVRVCDQKPRGGSWGWEATTPDGDETPLEAVSLAVWGAKTTRRNPGRKQIALVL